jgi:dATP/dGTP diphosphohydrolase, N-terminal
MTQDAKFKTGAVRSGDTDSFDYTSIPLLGLMAVARTSAEGAQKYGRLNYQLGMPSWTYINHAMHHLTLFSLGDREQPHLAHATWNLMAAQQAEILDPDGQKAHNVGPGATLTGANRELLGSNSADLKSRRMAGEFKDSGNWALDRLPDVVRLLKQRAGLDKFTIDGLDCDLNEAEFEAELAARLAEITPNPKPSVSNPVIYLEDSQQIVDRITDRAVGAVIARFEADAAESERQRIADQTVEDMKVFLADAHARANKSIELGGRAMTSKAIADTERDRLAEQAHAEWMADRKAAADKLTFGGNRATAQAFSNDPDGLARDWNPPETAEDIFDDRD